MVLGASLALAPSPATAFHIPGATYMGTTSEGASLELDVSADGAKVTRFSVGQMTGDICTFSNWGVTFGPGFGIAIVNHAFDYQAPFPSTGSFFKGNFSGVQSGVGSLVRRAGGCQTPELTWNATTTATPPPQCSDGVDNDGDGKVDLADPGCTGPDDNDEADPPPQPEPQPEPEPQPQPQPQPEPQPQPQEPADTVAPDLSLSGGSTQTAGKTVVVAAKCRTEACVATATGFVDVPRTGVAKRLKLKRARASLAAGEKKKLKLRVPRKVRRAIRRALRRGKTVKAKVRVVALDAAGNRTVRKRTIRLKR